MASGFIKDVSGLSSGCTRTAGGRQVAGTPTQFSWKAACEGKYKRGEVTEVISEKTFDSYNIKWLEGEEQGTCTVLEDLNQFVRPIARFGKGTKVLAKVASGFAPGTIEDVYHPEGVRHKCPGNATSS